MIRTQVQLTAAQMEALRQVSAKSGRSVADLVRESVDLLLQRHPDHEERIPRALAAVGKFSSGKRDVSVKHDEYLAEAFRH